MFGSTIGEDKRREIGVTTVDLQAFLYLCLFISFLGELIALNTLRSSTTYSVVIFLHHD